MILNNLGVHHHLLDIGFEVSSFESEDGFLDVYLKDDEPFFIVVHSNGDVVIDPYPELI